MAQEKDVVLVYYEDSPLFFARIEDISPDVKKDWYLVKLLVFQVPLTTVTWILRDVYIDGGEFTMNGKKMRLELVVCPDKPDIPQDEVQEDKKDAAGESASSDNATVISLFDRKK